MKISEIFLRTGKCDLLVEGENGKWEKKEKCELIYFLQYTAGCLIEYWVAIATRHYMFFFSFLFKLKDVKLLL